MRGRRAMRSGLFRKSVRGLVAAEELNATEADEPFERLVTKGLAAKVVEGS